MTSGKMLVQQKISVKYYITFYNEKPRADPPKVKKCSIFS